MNTRTAIRAISICVLLMSLLFLCVQAQESIRMTTGTVGDGNDQTGRLEGLIIGVDAGHQGKPNYDKEPVSPGSSKTKAKVSSGTQGIKTKTPEHEVNLSVALKLRDALENEGATVIMVRETAEVDISNIERAQMMNEAGADLVLRIHCNGVDASSARGMAMYVRSSGAKAQESDDAAHCLIDEMIAKTGAKDRGVAHSDEYSGLNWSEVPSVLIEMGFLTNPEEEVLLISGGYQDKLVSGMVEGIADYFERNEAYGDDETASDETEAEETYGE